MKQTIQKNRLTKRVETTNTKPKSKRKVKSEEYLKYQKYIKSKPFKEIRDIVLERDEHRCVSCGWTYEEITNEKNKRSLQCHHSTYNILYNELENDNLKFLITLCSVCHKNIHRSPLNMKRFAFKGEPVNSFNEID